MCIAAGFKHRCTQPVSFKLLMCLDILLMTLGHGLEHNSLISDSILFAIRKHVAHDDELRDRWYL